jgi:hypothetical protein
MVRPVGYIYPQHPSAERLPPLGAFPAANLKETMMRSRILLSLSLSGALACSADQPTEIRPQFAVGTCTDAPSVTANPRTALQPPQNGGVAKFDVKNNCTSETATFIFSSGKTGSVSAVFTPSPVNHTLAPGMSVSVSVPYNTGAAGSGTVVLTATQFQGSLTNSGSQTVTVGNCTANPSVTVTPSTPALQPPQNGGVSKFIVKNNCAIAVAFSLTSGKTGSVSAVFAPIPDTKTLTQNETVNVSVPYNTGVVGSGTAILTASALPALTKSGSQAVVVSVGIPFGPFNMYGSDYKTPKPNTDVFTASINHTDTTSGTIAQIHAARVAHKHLVLMMTDGCHSNEGGQPNCAGDPTGDGPYRTNGVFQLQKWMDQMDRYATPTRQAFRDTVAAAVADGTILGNSVLDEPSHSTWGPKGSITKAMVDQMCTKVRTIFPSLPVGVVTVHYWSEPGPYKVCDFIVDEFSYDNAPTGGPGRDNPTPFRNAGLAFASANGMRVVFEMNILHGGIPLAGCTQNCPMQPADLDSAARILGAAGSGLVMWQYDATMMNTAAYKSAFSTIANDLAGRPTKTWVR